MHGQVVISRFLLTKAFLRLFVNLKNQHMEVVEWTARLARKQAFRVRRLLTPLSMMHILL